MEIDNKNENFVSMEIQIWNNKDSNSMFLYKNGYENELKKLFFNFDKKGEYCYLIKTKENYIQVINEQKDFDEKGGNQILFRIRNSLKNENIYEVINPINEIKNFISDYNNFLNDKIWFSVKSQEYYGGNKLNYNLNVNDVVKFGKKKYIIGKIHFSFDNRKENIKDEDENYYKENNISYISLLNKKSKAIFKIDIKPNQYKINNKKSNNNNNKNYNNEKINKEENEANNVNKKEFKNIKQNNHWSNIDTNNNSVNTKNFINNTSSNISSQISSNISSQISSNASSQNNAKNVKNNYPISQHTLSTRGQSSNVENVNDNDNESNSNSDENDTDKCWICFNSNCDEDDPLICLCNCHNNFSHYTCLKMYLNSKIRVTENLKRTVKTYTCVRFNCDICLKPYKLRFRIPEINKIYELIDLTLPEELDYICFESLDYIKDKSNIKTIHIAQLTDEQINIGRNNYNDIIEEDTSVSRDHAVIKYDKLNHNIFLENKNGRYGTLVLVRGNIKIKEEKTFFQILNTHISMELTNKRNFEKIEKETLQIEPYNTIFEKDNDYY